MAHLGERVAAFVDGQLAADEHAEAIDHLATCADCRARVDQQRLLKHRMTGLPAAPAPPASLLTCLADMDRVRAAACPPRRSLVRRLMRSDAVRALVAVTGASVTVTAAAYLAGAPPHEDTQTVTPPVDTFVAQFTSAASDEPTPPSDADVFSRAIELGVFAVSSRTPAAVVGAFPSRAVPGEPPESTTPAADEPPAKAISTETMSALTRSGWPCHVRLAQGLERVQAEFVRAGHERVVTLTYTDGSSTLSLFEQSGSLGEDGPAGFEPATVEGTRVWVRLGSPAVATWSDEGVVFTAVSDLEPAQLNDVIGELPKARTEGGPMQRVGRGIEQLSAWADPLG